MPVYEQWERTLRILPNQTRREQFMKAYYKEEQKVYERIIGEKTQVIEGTVEELAARYQLPLAHFVGFLDGINESVDPQMDMETLEADSKVSFSIDWEKLFHNMLEAKADWLYNIPAWGDILDQAKRDELKKAYRISGTVFAEKKVGRNDPCPCGSGKKYKKCHGAAANGE